MEKTEIIANANVFAIAKNNLKNMEMKQLQFLLSHFCKVQLV